MEGVPVDTLVWEVPAFVLYTIVAMCPLCTLGPEPPLVSGHNPALHPDLDNHLALQQQPSSQAVVALGSTLAPIGSKPKPCPTVTRPGRHEGTVHTPCQSHVTHEGKPGQSQLRKGNQE